MPEEKIQSAKTERLGPFGPFILERRIAVGGSAEVFLARPRQGFKPARQLVIKRLARTRGKAQDFELLSREAELHRAVQHPNVVTVFGAGMVGDEPYLAMEHVPGVDLHRLLTLAASENEMLPAAVTLHVARSIAAALHAVHSARDEAGAPLNITHGDVSPSNIYLSLEGEVKLGDFGVARALSGAAESTRGSRSGELLRGKVGYFAPERLKGEPVDQRADLFALGVVLGEMLIGAKMFVGSSQLAALLANRDANIEPLRRASGQLPGALYRACTRALEPDPARRYPNALALAEDLGPGGDETAARAELAEWVAWARDGNVFARQLERRLRHSSNAGLAAAGRASEGEASAGLSAVRRGGVVTHAELSFSALVELAATGHLTLEDEVALAGEPFRPVETISELARYLMPSTANTTAQLFEPGVPDYTTSLRDTPMLDVLARMRNRRESGVLFVTRPKLEGGEERKELYLQRGRLIQLAASDREDLLGQYMLRTKLISRAELDEALGQLKSYDGRLDEAVIGLGFAERGSVQRSVRSFARDRVAALCGWREGQVHLYRGSKPAGDAPLDLDLTVPMMTAALHAPRPERAPELASELRPGRRHEDAADDEERASAPSTLLDVVELVASGGAPGPSAVGEIIARGKARQRVVSEREARAALTVAVALEWITSD